MASWFKGRRKGAEYPADSPHAGHTGRADVVVEDSTIEVRAQVIAAAQRAAEAPAVPPPAAPEAPAPAPAAVGMEEDIELENDFRVEPALVSIAPEVYDQALDERGALIALCIYAHDRARSSGVAERIEEGLSAVGVSAVRPDGARFDPALHEAGGTAETADGDLDGTVAETEVVGFSDRGRVLRPPIVTVYTGKATPA